MRIEKGLKIQINHWINRLALLEIYFISVFDFKL